MEYYTSIIPYSLAEKLKAAGMPEIKIEWNPIHEKYHCFNTYAEVFDWLMGKGIGIGIKHHWSGMVYQGYDWNVCQFCRTITPHFDTAYGTWHEAANAAIEKALTLI